MSQGKYLIAGGGTGGHVFPGLAVGLELQRRGHSILFVGTSRGLEAELVPKAGFPLRLLRAGALKQVSWARRLRTLVELPAGMLEAAGILEETRPEAVLSLGGYASGPVTIMAVAKEIPIVVMEPNACPGFTHRLIGPFVARALLGFEQGGRFFPSGRWEVIGIPIRREFFEVAAKRHASPFTVLVTGGSQGSHRLNTTVTEALPLWSRAGWLERLVFLHQSGGKDYEEVRSRYRKFAARAEVSPFLDDMPAAFARADVVVCRSGASTIAELCAAGKASILVPFPFAADQHQLRNAEVVEAADAARLVEDRNLTAHRLFEELGAMLESPGRLEEMEAAARKMARPGAAARAAEVLESH